jgi:hypothetical protein
MSSQLQLNSPVIQEEERELGVNEGEVEVQPDGNSNKKRTNEATNSSPSKESKKHIAERRPEDSNVLKKLIRELSSDTTEIKEKKGFHRESEREASDGARIFFDLYYKITKAEELNETAHHGLVSSYYSFGEELEKRLAHFTDVTI